MDKKTKVTVFTNTECSETVAYFMEEATANFSAVYDLEDLKNCGWDYIQEGLAEEYSQGVRVVGFCDSCDEQAVVAQLEWAFDRLRQNFADCGSLKIVTEPAAEVDWLSKWKKNFAPIVLGDVCICPKWIDPPKNVEITLFLDSGIAFGTGYHETTSQCVLLCQQIDFGGKNVVDVGCGSGILGLVALKLGASHAVLVDMDSQATQAAQENAELNGLTDKCDIVCGDLTKEVSAKFDVCFANLTADILLRLVQDLPNSMKNGGFAILSGILNSLADKVEKAFIDKNFSVVSKSRQGEWSAFLMRFEG